MHRFVAVLCCWMLAFLAPLEGLAVKRFHFTNYRTTNGLSSNCIFNLEVDSRGFLWLATDYGINRFDGAAFSTYLKENYPSLDQNIAIQVCRTNGDGVYVSGYNGFLQRYDYATDTFETFFPRSFTQAVKDLYFDAVNDEHFALTTGGVYRRKRGERNFTIDPVRPIAEKNNAQCIINDQFGHYWIAESDSVSIFSYDGRLLHVFRPSSSHIQTFTPQLMSLPDGRVMVCYQTNKVDFFSFTEKGGIVLDHSITLPFFNLTGMQITTDGAYWFSSDGDGLWWSPSEPLSGNDVQKVLPYGSDGDEIRKIYDILADSLGNLWVATQNDGLLRYSGHDVSRSFLSTDLGIPRGVGTGFCELPSGRMMLACDGSGLYEFSVEDGYYDVYSEKDGLKNRNLVSLMCDSKGRVWTSTWGTGIFVGERKGGRYKFETETFAGLDDPQTTITNFMELEGGDVWACASGDAIYVCHKGRWSRSVLRYPWNLQETERWPFVAFEVNAKEHWVQTSCCMWTDKGDGLLKPFDMEKFIGPERYIVNDVAFVPSYGVVLATQKGLLVAKSDTLAFSKIDWCPDTEIYSIVLDKKGCLWAAMPDGVWGFNLQQKKSVRYPKDFAACGRNYFVKHSRFCNSGNSVFFGTKDGFFCFNADSLSTVSDNNSFCLSRVEVDGAQVDFGTLFANQSSVVRKIKLPYGHSSFAVCADVPDFSQQRPAIVYRLVGADTAWKPVDKDQRIVFSYLSPGDYRLEVKLLGMDNSGAIKLDVSALMPWWQSNWFKGLCLALVVLLVGYKLYRTQRDKKLLLSMVDERTQELKIQKDLVEQRNQELNAALSAKDRLMTVVAHDLKNPMFAVVGALEGLRRKNHVLDEAERASLLDSMIERTKTMQNELGKLLAWATSKQDDLTYRPSNVDLSEIIENDVDLLTIQAEEKGIVLHSSVEITNYVYADSRMIATAIRNVLGNSLKFTPCGKSVRIRAWQDADYTFVEISDDGVGMSEAKLRELLVNEVNLSTVGTGGESGSGLGLGLVKHYVSVNGGSFSMTSTEGKGTSTLIKLPTSNIPVPTTNRKSDPPLSVEVDAELMSGNCVLVVDDDLLIQQHIKSILDGYVDILLANNGKEALDMLASNSVDVVLSDVEMPVMNGIEMSNALKSDANYNHIPVLFLSAKSSENDRLLGLLTGAVDYIVKPFSPSELLVKLGNILALRRRQQQFLLEKFVGPKDEASANQIVDLPSKIEKVEDGATINPYLQRVIADIEANYSNSDYGIEQMAANLCTTRITLYRKVKSLSGQNPSDLLIDYRLNKSCQLLKEKQMPVQDVAYAVGFSDYAYFSRRFKARFGQSPKEYAAL